MHKRMTAARRLSPTCKATLRHDLKATHCNTLQHTATLPCVMIRKPANCGTSGAHATTHCNTLQHTDTRHSLRTAVGLRLAVSRNKLISGASAYVSGYMYTSASRQVHLHISTSTSTADCGAGACRCRHPHPPCGCQQMRQRAHPDRQSRWTPKSRLRCACLAIRLLPQVAVLGDHRLAVLVVDGSYSGREVHVCTCPFPQQHPSDLHAFHQCRPCHPVRKSCPACPWLPTS
mmetsp:Transcript_94372/g.137766  ORF Transcript_94372/g.137766 Transcript_94372/m.137766 type:complete len:232 (+) Transcript_94372:31-726(+)